LSSSLLSQHINIKISKIIILPVALHGYETWSHKIREECRLRECENRELRRIFVPKREEVEVSWKGPCNDQLHNLYTPSINTMVG
jgi:hypothetical protein